MPLKLPIPAFLTALLLAATPIVQGQVMANRIFADRAKKEYFLALAQFQSATNNATNAVILAHKSFDYCELATNAAQRAELARTGIAACRQLLAREPQSAPGHYYLGMNLGELAQAEAPSLAAYKLVHEVEREFARAAELDEHYDFAGPARNLGELYFQAPGWPFSVGSKHKAREWLERAVALAPDYPDNQLNLAEAQLKWRQPEAFAATMKTLDALWPSAQTHFAGAAWEPSWLDWQARRTALKAELKKNSHAAP